MQVCHIYALIVRERKVTTAAGVWITKHIVESHTHLAVACI